MFRIVSRLFRQGVAYYKIVDLKNEPIAGYVNEREIIVVNIDEDSLWYIENFLKRRKVKGKLQYFVHWEGFPKSFDSWIDTSEVKDK